MHLDGPEKLIWDVNAYPNMYRQIELNQGISIITYSKL